MSKAICEVLAEDDQVTPEEAELLRYFRQLCPSQKEFVTQAIQGLVAFNTEIREKRISGQRLEGIEIRTEMKRLGLRVV